MRVLMTTDLHLNAREDDSYRWKFLTKDLVRFIEEYEPDALLILGDLTHDKDRHPATLVNAIVDHLLELADHCPIYILKGNHDYVEKDCPFFRFLPELSDSVEFIWEPTEIAFDTVNGLFLPHTRNPLADWELLDFSNADYLFLHETVHGSKSSNGFELEGVDTKTFKKLGFRGEAIFSGDIHVPQTVGPVIYIGTPYHVHFGDNFAPRLLLLDMDTGDIEEIPFSGCPKKVSLKVLSVADLRSQLKTLKVRAGDFVKVKLELSRADYPLWNEIKSEIRNHLNGLEVHESGIELSRRKQSKRVQLKTAKTSLKHFDEQSFLEEFSLKEQLGNDLTEFGKGLL